MSGGAALPVGRGVVKGLAIVGGGLLTVLSLMSIVGAATSNGYVQLAVALVLAIGVPAFVIDRLLPKEDFVRVRGLVSEVFSVVLLGFAFVFCGLAQPLTKPLLVAEGDRLALSGLSLLAEVAYFFGGVRPEFPTESPPAHGATALPLDGGTVAPAAPTDAGPPSDAGASDGSASASSTPEETPAQLFKEWAPSVVCIQVALGEGEGGGTGFFIDDSGTIATNAHVIEGARNVKVKLFSGKWIDQVDLLTQDTGVDLALLRIKPGEKPKPVALGDSDAVTVGERIIAIGNPLGLEYTLTDGLVSSRRMLEGKPMIQMSVPVSPGNSGGPVINMHGQVIGVTTLQITGGMFGRAQNLNMAVPIKALRALVKAEYPERRSFGADSAAASTW
jgi:hypothetical protein